MFRHVVNLVVALITTTWLACAAAEAQIAPASADGAERRLALVIGNSAYRSVGALTNPGNDARAVSEILNAASFEVVRAADLTLEEMQQVIGDFAAKLSEAGPNAVALVFFAGHGLQVDGENFLIPVDAQIGQQSDVTSQSVRLADLMRTLEAAPSKMRIVILDACRNNPFSALGNAAGKGLAIVDAPARSIVAYSTAPGAQALDGNGLHSPYTAAFMKVSKQSGVPIEQFFKRVRVLVSEVTDGKQFPWESSSLTGDFVLFPTINAQIAQTSDTGAILQFANDPAVQLASIRTRSPYEAYEMVVAEDTVEFYEEFIRVYPNDSRCERIRELLARRRQMLAWQTATRANSSDAYDAYVQRFPNSDLAAAALRLRLRPHIELANLDFFHRSNDNSIKLPLDRIVTLPKNPGPTNPQTGIDLGGVRLPSDRITTVPGSLGNTKIGDIKLPSDRVLTLPTNTGVNPQQPGTVGGLKLPSDRIVALPANTSVNPQQTATPQPGNIGGVKLPSDHIVTLPANTGVSPQQTTTLPQAGNIGGVRLPSDRIVTLPANTGVAPQQTTTLPQPGNIGGVKLPSDRVVTLPANTATSNPPPGTFKFPSDRIVTQPAGPSTATLPVRPSTFNADRFNQSGSSGGNIPRFSSGNLQTSGNVRFQQGASGNGANRFSQIGQRAGRFQ